ncbi:D-xylose ABC transporter substrate-binding protein [Vallitalea longa]|uniref:D-xylose ABC transporter substrate-binding protein n=1 Tax=Vallitalea longa TaxID=2936439 RepID=A0A9W5YAD2_9FIRM|nr:substrate-binding domain-containing protein [Vallitalea longa]GKX30292.1 D-xylose ABC transporter substrate-binding protein [Vallitalea longa]
MSVNKKLKVIIVIVSLLIIIVGTIIVLNINSKEDKKVEDDTIKIGLSIDSLVIERWQRDRNIFVAKAKELGAEVLVLNANEDNDTQIKQIRYLIDQDVDVLVIIPYDKNGITEVIKSARKKGIKVISYDRLIVNADVDYYVSFDNEKVGQYMAESVLQAVPKGNYVIINGSSKDNNSKMFNKGTIDTLKPYVEKGDIDIIKEVWAEDWREEVAYSCIEETLSEGKQIDGIIAANDRLAEGAIEALAENRIAGDVAVVGHDADLSACQRIVEGTQLMTVYKPIKILAEAAAEIAFKIAQGKIIENDTLIDDGTYYVKYIKYDVIPVTKDNIEETIIRDGFHIKEDIYRNIPDSEWKD